MIRADLTKISGVALDAGGTEAVYMSPIFLLVFAADGAAVVKLPIARLIPTDRWRDWC